MVIISLLNSIVFENINCSKPLHVNITHNLRLCIVCMCIYTKIQIKNNVLVILAE